MNTIQDILKGYDADFDASKHIKILRHADTRKAKEIGGEIYNTSLYSLYRENKKAFLGYQSEQTRKGIFDKTEYLVSCLGEEHTLARFIGVYKIIRKIANHNGNQKKDYYICEEVETFSLIRERVIIEWGKGTQSWYQDYTKNIKKIKYVDNGIDTAKGYPYFKSYSDTKLNFSELKAIFNSNDADWKSNLTAVNCIYLIKDRKTGKQYIGSTYRKEGIWGRWKEYVEKNGHGGDKDLKRLIKKDSNYAVKNFYWIILETLPINITDYEAIKRETMYKDKFMSRVPFGYNLN